MATPFSPFVGRRPNKPLLKRRQSELPSDLIDWEAPTIPELDKQRIIYEDYIKEMEEDHQIETMLNEEIFQVAHECIVDEYKAKLNEATEQLKRSDKTHKDELATEKSRVHLLLGQIKMYENNIKEYDDKVDERVAQVESENTTLRNRFKEMEELKAAADKENVDLRSQLESLQTDIEDLKTENENLNFKNDELNCELTQTMEIVMLKKNEADDTKRKLNCVKNQLAHYKRLAKGATGWYSH